MKVLSAGPEERYGSELVERSRLRKELADISRTGREDCMLLQLDFLAARDATGRGSVNDWDLAVKPSSGLPSGAKESVSIFS